MRKIISLLAIIFFTTTLHSSEYEYKYRLYLKDKGDSSFVELHDILSDKAIARREKQNIRINNSDSPISPQYLQEIEDTGSIIVAKSKWNKTVAVHVNDSLMREQLGTLPFVDSVMLVWRGKPKDRILAPDTLNRLVVQTIPSESNFYGQAYDNIKMLKGDTLHSRGFMGEGMTIAVIDAGFNNLPHIDYLDNINLLGHKSFIYENDNLFQQDNQHGINVLSCMATNKPYQYVGTAPHASYWMLGTEDSLSEYPIEEDYWAEAIEYADSVGVDVVNTSLGYTIFDAPARSFTRASLDGKTALISRSAGMAAKKGMLVVISAGNAGNKSWARISAPADAKGVLAVGSVMRDSTISAFSSRGLTEDLRIKPDVVALGSSSALIDDEGLLAFKSGTSFSSPIVCGIAACLWQAFPTLTNYEIIDAITESGDRFEDPSYIYGFGIPDMEKAIAAAKKVAARKERQKAK